MIGISKLYAGTVEASDPLRYGRLSGRLPSHLLQFSVDKKPVVVWNATSRCNLKCEHCYAAVSSRQSELTTGQAKAVIDDLAGFGVPVVLFSGGEPFVRPDIFELAEYAASKGLRVVFSTNGTLIDDAAADRIAKIGVSYVGISMDGMKQVHDAFRGVQGAFDASTAAIRRCRDRGVKVGLRVTITRGNVDEIPAIFDYMERERIPRICLYHLVYCGRGAQIMDFDLDAVRRRETVRYIMDRTRQMHRNDFPAEVLTVDNHCDGPFLYLQMKADGDPRADEVLKLLQMNGGNSTGLGIACIGWDG
jgi:MoaA/NifB/PqqE/SkfB family radical SAM enzyme